MELIKEEQEKKQAKLIIVVGLDEVSKQFMQEAIARIITMTGLSVNLTEEEAETDFQVLKLGEFSIEKEAKSSLVFSSYKNPFETNTTVGEMYELLKWMRSSKLAYCMDFDAPMNKKGLHNYSNLRNFILPMNFAFQREGMDFSKIKPVELIESLVPQLKEESEKSKELFEKTKEEKTNG